MFIKVSNLISFVDSGNPASFTTLDWYSDVEEKKDHFETSGLKGILGRELVFETGEVLTKTEKACAVIHQILVVSEAARKLGLPVCVDRLILTEGDQEVEYLLEQDGEFFRIKDF